MATVINTIYPPIIPTFSNAFIYKDDAKIYYNISRYNSPEAIQRVHITVVNQLNNENALSDATGVLFQSGPSQNNFDAERQMYYVTIPVSALKTGSFNLNQYYKVQVRFDNKTLTEDDVKNYGNNIMDMNVGQKQDYLLQETAHFSEWSSVCLIRGIEYPHLRVKVFDNYSGTGTQALNKGIIPIVGRVYFDADNDESKMDQNETETVQSFEIQILDDRKQNVLLTSGAVYTGNTLNPNDLNTQIDTQTLQLDDQTELYCRIIVITKNQYTFHKDYKFQIAAYDDSIDFKPTITTTMDNENGIAIIHVETNKNILGGTCYIKRLSSLDDFSTAELVRSVIVHGTVNETIEDNTVSSLTWYKYSVQYKSKYGTMSTITYSDVIMPDFHDAIISRQDQQYAIRYNYTINNYKPVVNRAKIDTLGGKYPRFAENAILDYKQFSISGILSAEADMYQMFLQKNKIKEYDYSFAPIVFKTDRLNNYYSSYKQHPHNSILSSGSQDDDIDDEAIKDVVRNDAQQYKKYDDFDEWTADTAARAQSTKQSYLTTTKDDWLWEREFREELIKWLNDGEPKMYRSKQEGAMTVMMTDVSLTPTNKTRFTYNFTATIYEIADATSLEVLGSLGIFNVIDAEDSENTNGSSGKTDDDYLVVTRPGQLYNYVVTDKYDIRNDILNQLRLRYGFTGIIDENNNIDIDEHSALGKHEPKEVTIKNVKIFFQSKPNLFYQDKDKISMATNNSYTPGHQNEMLGYTFDLSTKTNNNNKDIVKQTIFVNNHGYYQIPDNLNITHLSFNNPGDVVTVEYTLIYHEYSYSKEHVSGITVGRNVIGQYEGIFYPDSYLGDVIKQKYNYVKPDALHQYMTYWKGICLDVTPYAMVRIKYHNVSGNTDYEVGGTGVLHMLKDFEVDDICFLGRRMSIIEDNSRQPYLEEWECCLDSSVTNSAYGAKTFNWFKVVNKEDTGKQVEIHTDTLSTNKITNGIVPIGVRVAKNKTAIGETYIRYSDVRHPKTNTVYLINNKLKIYYIDCNWYDFEYSNKDETNININTATQRVGLAKVPIEGQINYQGSVMTTALV